MIQVTMFVLLVSVGGDPTAPVMSWGLVAMVFALVFFSAAACVVGKFARDARAGWVAVVSRLDQISDLEPSPSCRSSTPWLTSRTRPRGS